MLVFASFSLKRRMHGCLGQLLFTTSLITHLGGWNERKGVQLLPQHHFLPGLWPSGHVSADSIPGYLVCVCIFLSSQECRLGVHRPIPEISWNAPNSTKAPGSSLEGIWLYLLPKYYLHFLSMWWAKYSFRFNLQADLRWVEASSSFTTFSYFLEFLQNLWVLPNSITCLFSVYCLIFLPPQTPVRSNFSLLFNLPFLPCMIVTV